MPKADIRRQLEKAGLPDTTVAGVLKSMLAVAGKKVPGEVGGAVGSGLGFGIGLFGNRLDVTAEIRRQQVSVKLSD